MSLPVISNLDVAILHWLNGFVGRWPSLDQTIQYLVENDLKGAIFISVFWWLWFRKSDSATTTQAREHLLATLGAGLVAIVVARVLAQALPFRIRPRFDPALSFVVMDPNSTPPPDWSSFPSDHAVMFSALAVGLWFISKRASVFALLYTVFIIGFPRIYLGIHYPTDVIAGLALGSLMSYGINVFALRHNFMRRTMQWESLSPGSFYCALFVLTFEFSTMFNSVRDFAARVLRIGAHLVAGLL